MEQPQLVDELVFGVRNIEEEVMADTHKCKPRMSELTYFGHSKVMMAWKQILVKLLPIKSVRAL